MSMNYASAAPTQRSTSFFIEDILLHKPKPLREVIPSPFCSSLASRMPILEYGYPLMPTPILAPHPHHPLHKPEHHQYFFTSGKGGEPLWQRKAWGKHVAHIQEKRLWRRLKGSVHFELEKQYKCMYYNVYLECMREYRKTSIVE